MSHELPSPLPKRKSLEQLDPNHIKPLADSLEAILPAVRALAAGGHADLVPCPSMYAEAPPPSIEEQECMFAIRVAPAKGRPRLEYLDLDELGRVAQCLQLLYDSWILRAGPDAFTWRPYRGGA